MINGKCDTCIVGKSLSSQCVKCAPGYLPSNIDLAKCIPEIPRCKSYTPTDTCLTCYDGFFLVNGKCDYCDTNNNFVLKDNVCVCKSGFKVSDSGSNKCSPIVPNCTTYERDTCMTCSAGNRLSNEKPPKCVPGVENCETYTTSNLCTKCRPGYKLLFNKCVMIQQIPNCINYYSWLINILQGRILPLPYCQNCASGYHPSLDKRTCILNKILNCNKYSN